MQITDIPIVTNSNVDFEKGVSAAYCGFCGPWLVMAGGANFPDVPAADGGAKKYYDNIYGIRVDDVLEAAELYDVDCAEDDDIDYAEDVDADCGQGHQTGESTWINMGVIPEPAAYGASFQLEDGFVIAGGNNGNGAIENVYKISLNTDNMVVINSLPSLPIALEQFGWATDGEKMVIVGGMSTNGCNLDVYSCKIGEWNWKSVAKIDTPSVQPVAALHNGDLYYWDGFNPVGKTASGKGFKINLDSGNISEVASVPENGTFTGSCAGMFDNDSMIVVGGVWKDLFDKALNIAPEDKKAYMTMKPEDYNFRKELLIYDFDKDKWSVATKSAKTALAGAAMAVKQNGDIYVLGGEIKPGIRTPQNLVISSKKQK